MDFLSQMQTALRGPTGAPQTADETIGKLADRLGPETQLSDRRAAAQTLRGLVKAHKTAVGKAALPGLLKILSDDGIVDETAGKAALDALSALCAVDDDQREIGLVHSAQILEHETVVADLFALLGQQDFYVRHGALTLLGTLIQARRQTVQAQFLAIQHGPATLIGVLDEKRQMLRDEGLALMQALATQSADVQKVLAFEGAFDRLFAILQTENGVDGGAISREVLLALDLLLRFNSSNQNFFRSTPYPPFLCQFLSYPPALPPSEPAPQEFALQFWDGPKTENVSLVVGLIGILANAKGGSPQEYAAYTRLLVEFALGSNAPTSIKSASLSLLPTTTYTVPLTDLYITAYVPVPETNGEEWDRLEPATALDALVELIVQGEFAGQYGSRTGKDDLGLRAAGLSVFESFVKTPELKLAILRALAPAPDSQEVQGATSTQPLLQALVSPPSVPPEVAQTIRTQLACILFSHLLRPTGPGTADEAKELARSLVPRADHAGAAGGGGGQFFVPADNSGAPPPPPVPEADDDDEGPQPLLATLAEHLALALLQRARTAESSPSSPEARTWDMLVSAYLALLSQWLWSDPVGVKAFLEAGALGMLVEPVNAPGADEEGGGLVPGMCAFLLGVIYEFCRDPGAEVTRSTIHPILTRLGVDSMIGRMTRVREDARFRAVTPEDIVIPAPSFGAHSGHASDTFEIWFDWQFVEFWKTNYYNVQKALAADPSSSGLSSSTSGANGGQNQESAMLVASLREVITNQAGQIDELSAELARVRAELESAKKAVDAANASAAAAEAKAAASVVRSPPPPASSGSNAEVTALEKQLADLRVTAEDAETRAKETEKEQEDLLVLLDELNGKRARDKQRMRKAGMEVSEDEDDGDDDEE